MDTAILTTLIATGAATGGVLLKMAYDAIIESGRRRRENQDRFIDERKRIYDDFLRLNKEQLRYRNRLQQVTLIARAGQQIRPEVLMNFPDSPMEDLTNTLEKMRQVTRTSELVKVAERIIRLHGDGAAALRYYLQHDDLAYGLPLFLANRLGEDQTLEFISAYRRDLHIGPPKGAASDFPIISRGLPISIAEAEEELRSHLQRSPHAVRDFELMPGSARPLTAEDIRELSTVRYRNLILEDPS